MRLPTPRQLDGLVELAGHDRPEVQQQALELCRALPGPVRMLAAARLAEQHAYAAAARCAWPDDASIAEALQRAVIRDCGEHIHPRWRRETAGDPALRLALEPEEAGRTSRAIRRMLEAAVRRHPSRSVYAMAIIGMAQLEEDPAAGLAACHDHLPLASSQPTGARPWMTARMLRHLAAQRPLTDDDRRLLAAAFAEALDGDDFERAGLLLTGGCAYAVRGDMLHGPEAILASYQAATLAAHERFDVVEYDSHIGALDADTVTVCYADHLTLAGQRHTHRCQQRLWLDELGRIWRVEHEDLPGERQALADFERSVRGCS